jgi:hypothetical protein
MNRFLGPLYILWIILTLSIGIYLRQSYGKVFVEISLLLACVGASVNCIYSGIKSAISERGEFVFWTVFKRICSTGIPWEQSTGYEKIGRGLFLVLLAAFGFYVFFIY